MKPLPCLLEILHCVCPGRLAVPYFWLKALKALDTAVQAIHRRDEGALEALADVRVVEAPALLGSPNGPTTTGKVQDCAILK